MSMITYGTICVTEFRHGGIHVDCYKSRLDMVLAELNSGALGEGRCHGDDEHLAALHAVIARAQEVIAKIEADRQEEACHVR